MTNGQDMPEINVAVAAIAVTDVSPVKAWVQSMLPGCDVLMVPPDRVDPSVATLVVYESLPMHLSSALLNGVALDDAAKLWLDQVQRFETFPLAGRKTGAQLIAADAAHAAADEVCRRIKEWLGTDVRPAALPCTWNKGALIDHMVAQVIDSRPDLVSASAKLGARGTSLPMAQIPPETALDAACTEVSRLYDVQAKLHEREAWLATLRTSLWQEATRAAQAEAAALSMEQKVLEARKRESAAQAARQSLEDGYNKRIDPNQIEALQNTVAEKDRQIAALYASNSWKITRPIRSVSLLLRRLKQGRP